jgi:hypothetical protein
LKPGVMPRRCYGAEKLPMRAELRLTRRRG